MYEPALPGARPLILHPGSLAQPDEEAPGEQPEVGVEEAEEEAQNLLHHQPHVALPGGGCSPPTCSPRWR